MNKKKYSIIALSLFTFSFTVTFSLGYYIGIKTEKRVNTIEGNKSYEKLADKVILDLQSEVDRFGVETNFDKYIYFFTLSEESQSELEYVNCLKGSSSMLEMNSCELKGHF